MGCQECLLKSEQEHPFHGNRDSEVVFVFDSPHSQYKELEEQCNRIGLASPFYINAARCKIDKERFTAGQISTVLENCRPKVVNALTKIQPKLIVCLGALAFQQIHMKTTLKKARNQFYWNKEFNCWVFVTYHPGATAKDPSKLPYFEADFNSIKRFIDNGYQTKDEIKYEEVQSIRPILDGDCYKEGDFYLTGVDTETQGVAWYDPNSILISYQISKDLETGWTVVLQEEVEKDQGDFNIKVPRGGTQKKPEYVEIGIKKAPNFELKINELKELLERQDIKKYFFNQKFEQHRFMNLGITKWNNCCMDAKVASHVLDSELYRDCTLEDLISQFAPTNENHKGAVSTAEKEDMLALLKTDREKFIKYASLDPVFTLKVSLELRKKLLEDKQSLNYFVNFAQPIETEFLFEMERNGVLVDKDKIPELKAKLKKEIADKELQFKRLCPLKVRQRHGDNFKLTRTVILQEALFEWRDTKLKKNQTKAEHHNYGFNLEPIVMNKKSGTPSTDKKAVMNTIIDGQYPKKVKNLISVYLEWGELNKLVTNYIKNIEEKLTSDNKLHASFSITFTSTGRVAARSPALMTIPKHSKSAHYIRELFIPENGFALVEKDFAAAEVRFVGQHSRDPELVKVLNQGVDIHAITAKRLNNLPDNYEFKSEEEKKNLRQMAKACVFGLLYLAKPGTLKRYAYQNFNQVMSYNEAEQFWHKFFSIYPGIKKWHEKDTAFLEKHGYLRNIFGRKRTLPNVFSSDESVRMQAIRTGINSQIQSISSDYALLGGYKIMKDPEIDKNKCQVVLFLHDALYFNIHQDYLDEVLPKLKYHMEHAGIEKLFGVKPIVPFLTETSVSYENLASSIDKE
jgi:uracil-DNA glycosylase family 4